MSDKILYANKFFALYARLDFYMFQILPKLCIYSKFLDEDTNECFAVEIGWLSFSLILIL